MLKKDKKTVKKGRNLDLTHAPTHCWSVTNQTNTKLTNIRSYKSTSLGRKTNFPNLSSP